MADTPISPESEQIADVAINDEETIIKRPPLEGDDNAPAARAGDGADDGSVTA